MSQAKVDRYKEQKGKRKQELQKKKMQALAWRIGGIAVLALLVGWLVLSGYNKYKASQPRDMATVDMTPVSEYLNNIGAEEEESDTEEAPAEDAADEEASDEAAADEETAGEPEETTDAEE